MAQYMEREGVCPVCRHRQATYGTLRYGATAVRYTAGYMGLRASSNPGTCIARYMVHRSSDIAGILIDIWRYRPMGNMGHLLPDVRLALCCYSSHRQARNMATKLYIEYEGPYSGKSW